MPGITSDSDRQVKGSASARRASVNAARTMALKRRGPVNHSTAWCVQPTSLLFLTFLLSITACDQAQPGERLAEVEVWSAELDLRIGSVQGDDAITRIQSLSVSSDGIMFTLHPMEQVVKLFDVDGSLSRSIGGRGDGPGEFQNAATTGWLADTLWVFDPSSSRFTMFAGNGDYSSSFVVPIEFGEDPSAPQPPRARGLLYDGTVHGSPPAFSRQVQDGTLTEHIPMLMTRDGVVTDTLPAIPFGRNQWAISDPDDPNRGGMYMPQPFADGPLWTFVPGERAVLHLDREAPSQAEGAAYTLTKISFAGDTLFSRSYPFGALPVSQVRVDSILDSTETMLAERGFLGVTAGQAREWVEAGFYQPKFKSPIGRMLIGRDSTIWLSENREEVETRTWIVLDPDGTVLRRVRVPSGLTVLVVDRLHVWGSERDDLDVSYLLRYRIMQPDHGG